MQLLVTVQGLDKVEKRFKRLEHNLGSVETMATVGEAIKRYNEKNWGRGVKDVETTGERWPGQRPLDNPAAAEAAGVPQLKETFRIKEVTPYSVTYGTDDHRARILQYGSKKMLKKRVLKLPRKQIKLILRKALFRGV